MGSGIGHIYDFYCDESGNSGGDFWNKDQPIYVLAGWLVKKESRFKVDAIVRECWKEYYPQSKELKSKDILDTSKGMMFLETFLGQIGQHCTPFFYLAEKRYLVAAKLVEAFLDPAHNENLYDTFTWLNKEKKNIAQTIFEKCPKAINDYCQAYKKPSLNLLEQLKETLVDELISNQEIRIAEIIKGATAYIDDILWGEEYSLTSMPKKAAKTVNLPVFEAVCNMVEHFGRQQGIKKIRLIHDDTAQLEKAYYGLFNIHRNAGEAVFRLQDGTYTYTRYESIQSLTFGNSVNVPMIQAADLLAGLISGISVRVIRGEELSDKMKELGKVHFLGTLLLESFHELKVATSSTSQELIRKLYQELI